MTHRLTIELRRLTRNSHDQCCSCGRAFHEADTSHAGYSSNSTPLYVGDCCQARLTETAARCYWQPRGYALPKPDASLWRYMDFAKFVALLKDEALFFSRADHLGDRFEGAKGVALNQKIWNESYLKFFRAAILNPPPGQICNLGAAEVETEAQRLLGELAAGGQHNLKTSFVSCWHESEVESEALWRLYCPPPSIGLAIRTSFAVLNDSMGDDPSIAIGRVQYVDFRKDFAELNNAIFRKRLSLSHEKEVRAVIRDHSMNNDLGRCQRVNLSKLLVAVTPSPFAPPWFEDVLKETMHRFGVGAPIASSELLLEPFF